MTSAHTIDVRAAELVDADAMCDAQVEGWRTGYRGLFPDEYLDAEQFDTDRRTWWRAGSWATQDATRTFAGSVDGAVFGFAVAGPERIDGEPAGNGRGEVYAFYLHPSAWGSGLASALMERAEQWLVEQGFAEASLWVLRDNPRARHFYEKAGWTWGGSETLWAGPTMPGVTAPAPIAEVQYIRSLG